MRQALALFFSVAALCLAVSAIFVPAIHGQTVPLARANMVVSYTSASPLVLIPVTGQSELPSLAPPECTPANHRETMLCGKDLVQLLFTEGNVTSNLLLFVPIITAIIVVIAILRMRENSAAKNAISISAGIVAVAALLGWWLLEPITGELPDVGYWMMIIAAGLVFAASLLGYSGRPNDWVEQRLSK